MPNGREMRMSQENLLDNNGVTRGLLAYWKEEIKSGVRYRQIYGKPQEWRAYKNMYRGFWGQGVVPVNIIYSIGRSLIPQVYFRNPRISITSKIPGFSAQAMVLERIDNYLMKETGLKYEMKSQVLDTYLTGTGPGILGYDSEYGFNPSFMVDSRYQDSGLTSFSKVGEKIEYTDNVKPGMPWYLRCNPEDFVVPWGTRKWSEARWFAFRKMRTLSDIKESPIYSNTANLSAPYHTKLEGSVDGNAQPKSPQYSEQDTESAWVELWEVHDKKTKKVYGLSLDHDKFLRDDEDFLQFANLPARVLGFNEDPDYFWWSSDARLISVQQEEINDIRTMAKKHRRVGLLKMIVDKTVSNEELEKLLDGDPKACARVDVGTQGDVRKLVAMLQSHVPPDLGVAAQECREDIREIIGFSRNQQGSFEAPGGRRTATEVNTVRQASLIRVDERRDIMADHLTSIIQGYNEIIFDNWSDTRVIDIVGKDAVRYWVKFTGDEIRGHYNYTINPEEQTPQDQQSRRADAEAFMTIAQKIPGMDMGYIMRQWARQFDWIDPDLLLPGDGAGRSPEKALPFNDFAARIGQIEGSFPGLGR